MRTRSFYGLVINNWRLVCLSCVKGAALVVVVVNLKWKTFSFAHKTNSSAKAIQVRCRAVLSAETCSIAAAAAAGWVAGKPCGRGAVPFTLMVVRRAISAKKFRLVGNGKPEIIKWHTGRPFPYFFKWIGKSWLKGSYHVGGICY